MTLIITVVHILVSLALIFVVLLQKGSGADMGAAFGGSSQSVFGARGSGSFLGKMTAGLATIFMLSSLSLAFFTTQKGPGVSVMEKAPIATSKEVEPVKPSGPPIPAKSMPQPDPVKPISKAPVTGTEVIPALPVVEKGEEVAIPNMPKTAN